MSLNKYLNLYSSPSTRSIYFYSVKKFLAHIYGGGSTHELADRYLQEERDYEQDINNFLTSISARPPTSIRSYIAGVKGFLLENDVELSNKFWRNFKRRIKGSRAATLDTVPSNRKLKFILTHMPIQGKALFLLMASSGMRIGEALQIELEDLEIEKNMINISGTYTKSGNPRYAFFSDEAKEYLEEWLSNRERYIKQATIRSARYGKEPSDCVFPFRNVTAYHIWNVALHKSGNGQRDKTTNRYKIHPHVLRKFFRTRMGAVIPVDIVEALIGHEGYLTEVYRRYTVEDLAKFYKEGEHSLKVFTDGIEVKELQREVEEKNKQLQTIINEVVTESIQNKNQFAMESKQLNQEISDLKKKHLKTEGRLKREIQSLKKKVSDNKKMLNDSQFKDAEMEERIVAKVEGMIETKVEEKWIEKINRVIRDRPELGYKSTDDYVVDALRRIKIKVADGGDSGDGERIKEV